MIIPRQQVISFTVLAGQQIDLTSYTKFNHDKVVGVVLLPDKAIFGDKIHLEINKQTVLPYGFDAGLISFRQFLNKDIRKCTYTFEEYAKGSEIRLIYKNNDKRVVNIDLILLAVQGDTAEISQRRKIQIIPVPFTSKPKGAGYEPFEIRTKTDFYYQELTGIFNDYFNFITRQYDSYVAFSPLGTAIRNFLKFLEEPATNTDNEKAAKKQKAKAIQEAIEQAFTPTNVKELIDIVIKCLSDYRTDKTPEPEMTQKNINALQELIESIEVYNDNFQSLSTIEITVNQTPVYPFNYPVANIIPRYRKTFNETMYQCSMNVQEADIFIRFTYQQNPYTNLINIPRDFNLYFVYNQIVKK